MHHKNYPQTAVRKSCYTLLFALIFCTFYGVKTQAQIYAHDFGATAIAAHPYTVAPATLNSHLSNSSWSNSPNAWTSVAGSTGEAIRLTSATNATITLTFNVDVNFQVAVTSFNFWCQRSNLGAQNWSMTINGITAGTGTIGTTGAAIGNTPVANAVSGLTGTVTVMLSLTGNTGNGTFRLDDFTLNGTVTSSCTGSMVTSVVPLTGPQNTLVTINGSGFLSGSETSAVKFNGIPATSFNVVSDNVIKAYVPAGNATGEISVTTNSCEGFSGINFTKLVSVATPNYSSDIYISEIYDAQAGDGGVIEIYNGTANPVNLSGYTIRRYGDIGGGTFYTINLTGTMPPGGIFLIGIGTGTTPCAIVENQHYGTGFNSNDEFQLYNNGTLIDNVHAPTNVGYSVIRNPNATAPKPVFNSADWNTSTTESCANIGIHNVPVNNPPTILSPNSAVICDTNSTVFSVSLANPSTYTYQWKTLNASGVWVNVTNTAPFSGANTATLTVNPVNLTLHDSQYYCQITSSGTNALTNAAQLEVDTIIIPDFATTLSLCYGETAPVLNPTSPNGITGTWSPAVIGNTASGNYVFTPNPGQCAANVTLNVTISAPVTPDFVTTITLCSGATAPILNATSPNGISGVWTPSVIDNTTSGNYTFTPNAGQCADIVIVSVTVNARVIPDFATALTLCHGDTAPALNPVSPNGISGTWSSPGISNTVSGAYIFTPNLGECADPVTLNVTINPQLVPDFVTTLTLCQSDAVPILNVVSPNGISGSWSPSAISNMVSGTYIFTPAVGQCATGTTLTVTINPQLAPDFATTLTLCQGDAAPILNAVSSNGISGTWNPSTISNTVSGIYIFTPAVGQCATGTTLTVTVNPHLVPDFATTLTFCQGDAVPILNAVSPNGVSGTWSPSAISNTVSGTYIFTPAVGQCATGTTLTVAINTLTIPDFTTTLVMCTGAIAPILNAVSPNGITGTWSPSVISNTMSGSYVFTPNAGQCANGMTLNVIIQNATTPNFATSLAICSGAAVPVLDNVSPNGIAGTWSPSTVSNTVSGNYTFTPNAGQCATAVVFAVTVNTGTVPDFQTVLHLCAGSAAPSLNPVSPNGISGTWHPGTIDNQTGGIYTFTPTAGQCAATATLTVIIDALQQPVLQDAFICVDQSGQVVNPAQLYCNLPNSGYAFVWTWNGNPLPTTTNTHLATNPGLYAVTATNLGTGCIASAQANVGVLAGFTARAVMGADFDNDSTIAIFTNGGSGHFEFTLDDTLTQQNPKFFNVTPGAHTVTVRDLNGCAEYTLEVFLLDYPKYFSPNGDGYHDFWNIGGLSDQREAKIYVFDRYGKLIKSLKPSDTSGWDGTFNGRPLPSTDYWFELFYQNRAGQQQTFKAHFALKR